MNTMKIERSHVLHNTVEVFFPGIFFNFKKFVYPLTFRESMIHRVGRPSVIPEKGKSRSEKRKNLPKLTPILHGLLELGTHFTLTILLILISGVAHSPEAKIKHHSSVIGERSPVFNLVCMT